MTALEVGHTGVVRGRLPHNWRIAATFDADTGIVEIRSPDTKRFSVGVDTSGSTSTAPHEPVAGVLKDGSLEAKYDAESGVLRYDSNEVPEFGSKST